MPTVNMLEARSTLLRLVGAVESGAEKVIIIARNGRPAAKLVAIKPAQTGKRIGGSPKASSSSPTRSTLMMKPRSPRCSPGNPSEAAARHPHRPPRRPSPCHCVCSRTTPALRNTAIRLSWFSTCGRALFDPIKQSIRWNCSSSPASTPVRASRTPSRRRCAMSSLRLARSQAVERSRPIAPHAIHCCSTSTHAGRMKQPSITTLNCRTQYNSSNMCSR